jgi:hypothetical protein
MTTAEERTRILQMIQEGRISAEEGANLLRALSSGKPKSSFSAAHSPRQLRIRITDLHTGKIKVNVDIPMGLVHVGVKLGARFAPSSTENHYAALMEAVKSGTTGKVADFEDPESGERVEIWVE